MMDRGHPFIGFPTDSRQIGAFPGKIDLGRRYKFCYTLSDLYFCNFLEFLKIIQFSGESGRPTATHGGGHGGGAQPRCLHRVFMHISLC